MYLLLCRLKEIIQQSFFCRLIWVYKNELAFIPCLVTANLNIVKLLTLFRFFLNYWPIFLMNRFLITTSLTNFTLFKFLFLIKTNKFKCLNNYNLTYILYKMGVIIITLIGVIHNPHKLSPKSKELIAIC